MAGVCYKTSNNKYFECPPRMDDGRHFTDYRPSALVMHMAQYDNGKMSSHDLRQFLIDNASDIMEANRYTAIKKNGCHMGPNKSVPVKDVCQYNQEHPFCSVENPEGLGLHNIGLKPAELDYKAEAGVDKQYPMPADSAFPLYKRA